MTENEIAVTPTTGPRAARLAFRRCRLAAALVAILGAAAPMASATVDELEEPSVESTAATGEAASTAEASVESTVPTTRARTPDRPRDGRRRSDPRGALPEVTVTGQALPDPLIAVERKQASDVRGLFAGEPAVEIGGGARVAQRLYLRGIEGSNLNITVDGARQGQNLYNHRGGLANVDPEILKRVEVQPGPVAADQGHGALGGAIRFVTVDAQDRLAPGQTVGGLIKAAGASADRMQRGVIGTWAALGDEAGLLFYGTYSDYDDYRTGGGFRVPFSGGRDRTALLKWTLLDAAGHDLRVGIEQNDASGLNFMQRGDYPWQLQPSDFRARPPQLHSQRRDRKTLEWRYDGGPSWLDLSLRAYDGRDDFYAPNSNGERFTSDGAGWDVRNTAVFRFAEWNWDLVTGIDWLDEKGLNQRNNREARANRYQNTGLFVQNRVGNDTVDFNFGVRHDAFRTRFRTTNRVDDEATLVNLGGRIRFGQGWSAFGGYGEAARGAGTIPIHFAGNVIENATFNGRVGGDLRPELAEQRELGLRWGGDDDALTLEAIAFRTEIANPILYLQPGTGGLGNRPVTGFLNADRSARFSGFELRGSWRFEDWAVDGGLTTIETRDLPAEPQFLARYGAPVGDRLALTVLRDVGTQWRFGYTLTAVRRLDDVPADQIVFIEKPGYATHDLSVNWRSSTIAGFDVAFAVRNLTDKLYVRHTTFTQNGFATEEPGRDVRLTIAYQF